MNTSNKIQNTLYKLALRASVTIGTLLTVFIFLMLAYILKLSWSQVIIATLLAGGTSYIITYYTVKSITQSRLQTLDNILRNLFSKDFKNYDYLTIKHNDELDYVTTQAIRANNTIEREIKRKNRIEDYRKEFIGDVFHELKTPIFAVQGFIETLLDGAIDDKEVNRKFLKKAMRHTNRLTYLTKDLMQISELETGERQSQFQSVYLYDMVMDVVESLKHTANQEGVELLVDSFDRDLTVYADRHQIRRVLSNLVDNAIKYNTQEGKVNIGTKPFGSPRKKNRILVYVQDTGIGIPEHEIERITERFYRVDKSRSREKGGTGLGLSIVKHIMEVHGEEFFIESTPGEGSTFSFTLTKVYYPSV